MSLTLDAVLTAARDRSPYFFITRVTNAVVARFLSDAQNELIGAAVRRDPQYLAQTASLVLHVAGEDAPGTVGAGTTGGTPGSSSSGIFATQQETIGALVEARVTADEGASVFVAERVITSATATTATSTGAARVTNEDQDRVLVIIAGKGLGQRREILSNTTDTWTISTGSDGKQWTTVPDTTSIFDVVVPVYESDDTATVVTALPNVSTSVGYLVRVSALGVPYIDFTQPLTATVDTGATLPSMQFPLDATCWYTDGTSGPLRIISVSERFTVAAPAIYVLGQQVFLVGATTDWQDVASIAIRYSPIAPPFTGLTDTFLLPDHARPVLVSLAASFMATRVTGVSDVTLDPAPHHAEAGRANAAFLANVSAAKRGRGLRTREVW